MQTESKKVMLGLKLPTDPRWVNIVEKNIEEILTDHAYCEQKAASNAISCIISFHDYPYVHDLAGFIFRGGNREQQLVDRMLFAAMIEARSCERFRLLSEEISDESLREFYRSLMESEAEHYTTFITFARKYAKTVDVDARWKAFLEFESTLMDKYGKQETIHG